MMALILRAAAALRRRRCCRPIVSRSNMPAEAREFTGEIEDFGPLEKERKKSIKKGLKVMCRETRMAVAAAQLAIADAGFAESADGSGNVGRCARQRLHAHHARRL